METQNQAKQDPINLAPGILPAWNLDEPIIRYTAWHHRLHPLLLPHKPLHVVTMLSEQVCDVGVLSANVTATHGLLSIGPTGGLQAYEGAALSKY